MNLAKFDIIIPPQDINCEPGLQEKLANGDRAAFGWVYKNYCKKVYNYALLVTGDAEKSEDIVQDVFVRLWKFREKVRGIENFNGYFRLLYKNQVMNVLRDEGRERKNRKKYFDSLTVSSRAVDEIINFKETSKLIDDAVKQLPKRRRQMFEMKQEGMSYKEITQQLGKHPKTFYNQMQKAEKFLRGRLGM